MSVIRRYAAELFFEYRRTKDGILTHKRSVCEKKTIVFHADSDESAYSMMIARGKSEEFDFESYEFKIFYVFLGIIELISLEIEDDDVAWYSYAERLRPSERISAIIPKKSDLYIFKSMSPKGKMKVC